MLSNNFFNRMLSEMFDFERNLLNNEWEKKTYNSDDGTISFTYITNKKGGLSDDDEINLLKQKLDMAVESQEFETAVELRDKIKSLEKNKEKISKLKKELDESVKNQDFEKAIELRDKIKSLK